MPKMLRQKFKYLENEKSSGIEGESQNLMKSIAYPPPPPLFFFHKRQLPFLLENLDYPSFIFQKSPQVDTMVV